MMTMFFMGCGLLGIFFGFRGERGEGRKFIIMFLSQAVILSQRRISPRGFEIFKKLFFLFCVLYVDGGVMLSE